MIQAYTRLKIADNTGAKQIMCINVPVGARKYAHIGDIIVATVKRAIPHGRVKQGEVVHAVVVRVTNPYRRFDGSYIRFDEDAAVILGDERARTPEEMIHLTADEIDELIRQSTFHERKAVQILEMARRVLDEFDGEPPCDDEVMRSFSGVGPKCAHLVLGIACGAPFISVDIHVHRVTNRWGYVSASTPEKTILALEAKLPERYWIEINRLLVPFGKHICTGSLPRCSTCPVLDMCRQVGVKAHR